MFSYLGLYCLYRPVCQYVYIHSKWWQNLLHTVEPTYEYQKALKLSIFFFINFQRKVRLGISCELSARQTIHMQCQALFSLKHVQKHK